MQRASICWHSSMTCFIISSFSLSSSASSSDINAPSTWVLKCFTIACWDMVGCSSMNWRTVIQSCRVRFLRDFFSIHCAEDLGASFLGFSQCLHGLYGAGFLRGLHVHMWGIWGHLMVLWDGKSILFVSPEWPADISWHFRTETDGNWSNYMQTFPKILYMIMYKHPKRLYIIHYTQIYAYQGAPIWFPPKPYAL